MAMNIEVYNSVFAKNDRKEFPLDCLNSKPPRIKTTRVFKSSNKAAVIPILQTGCVIIIAIDIDVHAIENHSQNLARTFVTPLGDFYMFFCVLGLEADTVCINNATHPSRPG